VGRFGDIIIFSFTIYYVSDVGRAMEMKNECRKALIVKYHARITSI
jgi:hypothetical protein